MVKKTKDAKTSKRRTQVKNLSKSGKSLTTAEGRKVKGGEVQFQDFHFTKRTDKSSTVVDEPSLIVVNPRTGY